MNPNQYLERRLKMSVDEVPQLKRFEVVFERTVIVYAYDRPAAERTALTVETGHLTHTTKVVECNEVQSSADEPRVE